MQDTALTAGEQLNPYRIAQQQVEQAARYLPHLQRGLIDFLKQTARIVTVDFPLETDEGSIRMFTGYRCSSQPHPRPGEGRRSVSSRRDRGRGARPGVLDDLEMCRGQRSFRRRQRRRGLRSKATDPERSAKDHPAVHRGVGGLHRAQHGYPGARRRYRRRDHGMDLRYL